jgi:hypothetical protein
LPKSQENLDIFSMFQYENIIKKFMPASGNGTGDAQKLQGL